MNDTGATGVAEELVGAAGTLVRSGVLSPTGHINCSARIDDQRLLLSSIGLAHELTSDTFAVVRLDGEALGGRPLDVSSREIVGVHTAVYRARADAAAVVHTHSPSLTAFALAQRPLACRYEALLRRGQRSTVPVAPWAPRGSAAFSDGIGSAVAGHPSTWAILLANHGVLCFGTSALDAAKLLVTLEEAAAAELRAASLGGARDFPPGVVDR